MVSHRWDERLVVRTFRPRQYITCHDTTSFRSPMGCNNSSPPPRCRPFTFSHSYRSTHQAKDDEPFPNTETPCNIITILHHHKMGTPKGRALCFSSVYAYPNLFTYIAISNLFPASSVILLSQLIVVISSSAGLTHTKGERGSICRGFLIVFHGLNYYGKS